MKYLLMTLLALLALIASDFVFGVGSSSAYAAASNYEIFPREPHASPVQKSCGSECNCTGCKSTIEGNHTEIRSHMTDEMIKHRRWMIDSFFADNLLPAMASMANQISAVAARQTFTIGRFFDAKHQMESDRIVQVLMAEAHKDYQPSESLCEIGTFTKSLTASERISDFAHLALTERMTDRQRKEGNVLSAGGENIDGFSRIDSFINNYCNVNDNQKGLNTFCSDDTGAVAVQQSRINKDINFTRTLLSKPTISTDIMNNGVTNNDDFEDVLAMTSNLFSSGLSPDIDQLILATEDGKPREAAYQYMDLRALMAKRNVAQNNFAALTAERMSGSPESAPYIKSLMLEMGMQDQDVEDLLGTNPSYYAQRKVLTSHAFENPTFYTELYESPTNTDRKAVALKAVNLMLEDDFYDRQLESEMTLAIMLEVMLEEQHTLANRALSTLTPREN